MPSYSLSSLSDHALLRDLAALVSRDRATTAALLAHLAEVDERRLYLPAAHASMFTYCVHELRMSEDMAFKRIRVARLARRFPALFDAVAEGRHHLTGVLLLAPHLTAQNAGELLAAAADKTSAAIEQLLAERFPRPDVATLIQPISTASQIAELAARPVVPSDSQNLALTMGPLSSQGTTDAVMAANSCPAAAVAASGTTRLLATTIVTRARITPLAPGRYGLQVTLDHETRDLLRQAQALLGHTILSGDIAEVLKRALGMLVRKLEQSKCAALAPGSPRPKAGLTARKSRAAHSAASAERIGANQQALCVEASVRRDSASDRHIPAQLRRAVWLRDDGRCTFVGEHGRRCEARARLEFDHIEPVARGGRTCEANLRLRCRAHNQYTAECVFGAGFMQGKRERAARASVRASAAIRAPGSILPSAHACGEPPVMSDPCAAAPHRDVTPWLRQLGFSTAEARRGAELCAHAEGASLEQRVRLALRGLAPRGKLQRRE